MAGNFISVINHRVGYTIRGADGSILPSVSVDVRNSDTGEVVDRYTSPLNNTLDTRSTMSGADLVFFLPKGTYDITYTDVNNGDSFSLYRHYVGNVKSLKTPYDRYYYRWQRHIVDASGGLVKNVTVSIDRIVDDPDLVVDNSHLEVAEFYAANNFDMAVTEYTFEDYIIIDTISGLYNITVRDADGEVIAYFEYVELGAIAEADTNEA